MKSMNPATLALAAAMALSTGALAATDTVEIYTDSIPVGSTTTWTSSHIWRMHGKVHVRSGARLAIGAGTLVLADSRSDTATLLLVERGGRIYAEGTADAPIIFTSEEDSKATTGALANVNANRGLWCGIVILGRAPNNWHGGVGTELVEDIKADSASLRYGDSTAPNVHDTSGALRYVSIRHGGMADNSTIRGLTLASVGDGTVIDHLEVYTTDEDGIGLLGGTVNLKHVITCFNSGDALYYSYGYRGKIQFLFSIQNVITGGSSNGINIKVESVSDSLRLPTSVGEIWNATLISTGDSTGKSFLNTYTGKYKYALYYKKDGSGTFANSIVAETPYGGVFVDTSKLADGTSTRDSLGKTLFIKNNIWTHIGAGSTIQAAAMSYKFLADTLRANGNDTLDPGLYYSWADSGLLNPLPTVGGIAYQNLATVPNGDFFTQTTFRGAFGADNWAAGWSALSRGGYFAPAANVSGLRATSLAKSLQASLRGRTLQLALPAAGNVRIEVVDLSGRQVANLSRTLEAGANRITLPVAIHGALAIRVRASGESSNLLATLP